MGGCQSGRKVLPHDSKSNLPLKPKTYLYYCSVGPDRNKKITNLMKKVDKTTTYRKSCGFLSDAELEEYHSMFPNPGELLKQVPSIRRRRELWKTSASDILSNLFNNDENYYNLSEWNMWQNINQDR